MCREPGCRLRAREEFNRRQPLGKGAQVAVLNDEAHHVANAPRDQANRWKEFLQEDRYGFHVVLGFSGTCFVRNEYFADVIHRYSLRQAMEDRFVKAVAYVAEAETSGEEDERWQLVANRHEGIRKQLKARKLRPLTIVVTPSIAKCKRVGSELRDYLESTGLSAEDADKRVLVVYNSAPDVARLHNVDDSDSEVEWIISVSMLSEGWDVQRVFQIVPHEERAFNSKLLIAQVLGRGLRIPAGWTGGQPELTVFNHAAWAEQIRHLVAEVLETERRLTSKALEPSEFHFEIHNLSYDVQREAETRERKEPFALLKRGFVDIPSESESVDISVRFEKAGKREAETWQSTVKRRLFTPEEVAAQMFNTLEMLDMEAETDPDVEPTSYAKEYPRRSSLRSSASLSSEAAAATGR